MIDHKITFLSVHPGTIGPSESTLVDDNYCLLITIKTPLDCSYVKFWYLQVLSFLKKFHENFNHKNNCCYSKTNNIDNEGLKENRTE